MKIKKWIAIALVTLVGLYALTGFVGLPLFIHKVGLPKIAAGLNCGITLEKIRINPFALSIRVLGLKIDSKDNHQVIAADNIYLNLKAKSILKRQLLVSEITIKDLQSNLIRYADGSLNIMALGQSGNTQKNAPSSERPFYFQIDHVAVNNGGVDFKDKSVHPGFEKRIADLNLMARNVSNLPNHTTQVDLSLDTADAESLHVAGEFQLADGKAKNAITLKNLQLAHYNPYHAAYWQGVVDKGTLSASLILQLGNQSDTLDHPMVAVKEIILAGLGLRLKDADTPLIEFEQLAATDLIVSPHQKKINARSLTLTAANAHLERSKEGILNFAELKKETNAQPSKGALPAQDAPGGKEQPSGDGWDIGCDRIHLQRTQVLFDDRQPEFAAQLALNNIDVQIEGFSTLQDTSSQVRVNFEVPQQGRVAVRGPVKITPFSTELAIDLSEIPIQPFEPYWRERVAMIVTDGYLSANGTLNISPGTGPQLAYGFEGKLGLSRFASVDADQARDFLNWQSLFLDQIKIAGEPLVVDIGEISLTDYFARLIINSDGSVNIRTILYPHSAATSGESARDTDLPESGDKAANGTSSPQIEIHNIVFQNGRVDYSDRLIQPNVETRMLSLGGRVSGISSLETKHADVRLEGRLENHSLLSITGQFNPLAEKRYADLTIAFRDIDLSPLSPYTIKYLGRHLDKGKLTLELKYLLQDNKLKGENKAFIDQLVFGKSEESPDAIKLPLDLAVALLKDAKGEIALDLPVEGELDNPEFRLGKVIVRVIVNLVTGIVKSPFAAIAAIAGTDEDLSYLAFDPGQSGLSEAHRERLDKLALALKERPALDLEIQGQFDPRTDAEQLREQKFQQVLEAQKIKQNAHRTVPVAGAHEETGTTGAADGPDNEKNLLIETLYQNSAFPKPKLADGKPKPVSVDEMVKLIKAFIEITPEELNQLGVRRALSVKDYLLQQGSVDAERLFLLHPVSKAEKDDEAAENGNNLSNGVIFRLK